MKSYLEKLFTGSVGPLSNLATSVLNREFNLLFTPTSLCIVQYCEMDFNNNAQSSSAFLERCKNVPGPCFVVKSRQPILQFCFALTDQCISWRVFPMAVLVRLR